MKKTARRVPILLIILAVAIFLAVAAMNIIVIERSENYIYEVSELEDADFDYVLVLGAGYINDFTPSNVLADRLDQGLKVMEATGHEMMLLSGDSENPEEHDEVQVMKNYAQADGIDESMITCDPYGIHTYDSIWRARYVYGADSIVICTQKYHLNRAVYIARMLGMKVYGVDCEANRYLAVEFIFDIREVIARCKDYIYCAFKLPAKYTDK